MSMENYVRAAAENVDQNIAKSNQRIPTRCKNPIMSGYHSDTDTSPVLKDKEVTQYKVLVGVLRWAVDMGWVGILMETALMSTCLALPCRGHLKQVFHMFGYLKVNPKRKLCFDPQHPTIDEC